MGALLRLVVLTIFVSFLLPNPLFRSCTELGCSTGRGWPLPFYFERFCGASEAVCRTNYISLGNLIINVVIFAVIFFTILNLELIKSEKEVEKEKENR